MKRLLTITLALVLVLTLLPIGSVVADQSGTYYNAQSTVPPVASYDSQSAATQMIAGTTATVVGGWLRLRQAPDMNATTLASYPTGSVVTILGQSGMWYYVRTANWQYGYMYSPYLRIGGSPVPVPTQQPVSGTMYVTSANGRGVRLRVGPGTNYGVLGLYNVGTPVTVISLGTTWHRVRIGNQEGYMMAQYLTYSYQPVPIITPVPTVVPTAAPYGYTAYVVSKNGGNVVVREGAGTNYAALGSYPVGTQLTVLQHGVTWCLVNVNGLVGYMMTQFISTDKPVTPPSYKIQSASLNNYQPTVGTILTASYAPSGATVTYTWMDDAGGVLSYNKSFTVTEKQLGSRICVSISGYGAYSGKAVSNYTNAVTRGSSPDTHITITGVAIDNAAPKVGETLHATVLPAGAEANLAWYRENGTQVGSGISYTVQAGDAGYRLYCYATAKGNTVGAAASAYTAAVVAQTQALAGTVTLPNAAKVGTTITPSLNLNCSNVSYQWYQNGVLIGTSYSLTLTDSMLGDDIRLVVTAAPSSGYTGQVGSNYCIVQKQVNGTPGIIEI